MNLRSTPFLRLLFPFAAGLIAGARADAEPPGLAWALALLAVPILVLAPVSTAHRARWLFGAFLGLWLFAAGFARSVWYNELRCPDHFSHRADTVRLLTGSICDAPARGARLKVRLQVDAAGADTLQPCSGYVLLLVETDSALPALAYGDRLAVRANLRALEPPKNPEAFDYGRYLHFQNIHYQAFVKKDSLLLLSKGGGNPVWRMAFDCRDRLLSLLRRHFTDPDEYAVASALLVGYKDDLSDDLRTAYAETGSMHALAVSGTHVGLLYTGLLFLLQRIRWRGKLRRWLQTGLVLAVIWGFTLLTGASASVLRASVMFSVFLLGKSLHHDASIWNILAGSAFLLLLFNPYFMFDAGFQLSYAAVAGMVFFYPRLQKSAPVRLPGWLNEGWKVFLIGVAAQIGTLPLSLYYFHQFPCYFWLAGWVVVLGGAIFLWGGAALVLLDWLAPPAAGWLGWALHTLLWGMNRAILAIQQLPGSVIAGVWLPSWGALLLYAAILMTGMALASRRAFGLLAALLLLLILGAGRLIRSVGQMDQGQMVVYQVNKRSLVDFFDGTTAWAAADSVSPKQVLFAAQAKRWSMGVRQVRSLAPEPDFFQNGHLLYAPPFIGFYDLKIAWLAPETRLQGHPASVPVDVLLVSGNPDSDPPEALHCFPATRVVLDASNSGKTLRRWKKECQRLGISCHDVREQGAWIWTKNN
ncbi:MAG: ComEC/Rec2 family competence protein [Saprospiraceae bacterium]